MAQGRGYPIPKRRLRKVIWVNDTPHLSQTAATIHRAGIGFSYSDYLRTLVGFIRPCLTETYELETFDKAIQLALEKGDVATYELYSELVRRQEDPRSVEYMLDKLLEDKKEGFVKEQYRGKEEKILQDTARWIESCPDDPLKAYELKLFHKYYGEASTRTGLGYIKQVKQYLPERDAFANASLPNMRAYEQAEHILIQQFLHLEEELTHDGQLPEALRSSLVGFLQRARKTTFGGYPYLANMGDFPVHVELSDTSNPNYSVTFFQWYNQLALVWLALSPAFKVRAAYDFIALERVQSGGAEFDGSEVVEKKANKQRFVQAQSAVISHACKFFVDACLSYLKYQRSNFVADKFGEPSVTVMMKRVVSVVTGKEEPGPDQPLNVNLVGTDYSNYDASQDICISNDTSYTMWRLLFPACFTEYIIDPYIKCVYRKGRILTPGLGYVQTTGVKSGMVDTNQTDTINCAFADAYEIVRYAQEHTVNMTTTLPMLLEHSAANGDDRFGASLLGAADIERYDGELGFIAQKSKQEIAYKDSLVRDMSVTYLKTIVCYSQAVNRVIRTDAVSKLIMARIWPERVEDLTPASDLVSFFMSAARSTDSPNLKYLVDFLYIYSPEFKNLVEGELTFESLSAAFTAEQMKLILKQKGKYYITRKGIDAESIIEKMNTKFGYGDEGYRGTAGGLDTGLPDSGIARLPQVAAIMDIARIRKEQGTLGSTYA